MGQISDATLFGKGQFSLSVSGGDSEDTVRSLLVKHVKVEAMDDMDLIINAAMPGVRFRHTAHTPASIPSKTGHQYFWLENQGGSWDRIKQWENIALYIPPKFKDATIEILGRKG